MRSRDATTIESYRWRSDPDGVFYEALRRNRSVRAAVVSALVVIALVVALYISQLAVLGWIAGLALLIFGVMVAVIINGWWAAGGPSLRRWEGATISTRFVHSAGDITRSDGDGDEWVHWVVLRMLSREPRDDEYVVNRHSLRRRRHESLKELVPEEVRIRGGAASSCKGEYLEGKTVIQATTADGAITVICVPPSGDIYRVNDVPVLLQPFDGVRNLFS